MRFCMISDAHLFHNNAITVEKYNKILKEQAKESNFIVDCGDLTDKSNLSAPQLDALSHLYDGIDIPIYIVAGNHDSLDSTTVSSIFKMKPNIKVITKPSIVDNMLFVPYTNDINNLIKILDSIVKDRLDFAFSHLNITDSFYADISLKDKKKITKYAKTWFNGHIHDFGVDVDIFGSIFNVGSCSSLTFGDEYIPSINYYDTVDDTINPIIIENSIIHKTFDLSNLSVDEVIANIENITKQYRLRCRFLLENIPENFNLKKEIITALKDNNNVLDKIFSYKIVKKKEKIEDIKIVKNNKICLLSDLVSMFEQDNNIKLFDDIKKGLIND